MGWRLSLADLWTLGSRFKTATGIGVLKAGALGPSTASLVEKSFEAVSGKFSARTLDP